MILRGILGAMHLCTCRIWVVAIFAMGQTMSYSQDTIFHADFENNIGDNNWTLATNANDGNWIIGTPFPYTTIGNPMEIAAYKGSGSLLTGINFIQDLDGGPVTAQSASINIPSGTTLLTLQYYFSHYLNSSASDFYSILIKSSANNAVLDTLFYNVGTNSNKPAIWQSISADLSPYVGQSIYIQLEAADIANGSKVEAALDELLITNQGNNASVFLDDNVNGISDIGESGISGVIVSVYNDTTLITQVSTDSSGSYDLSTLPNGVTYRIEFDYSNTGYSLSNFGSDNRGDIRFATTDQLPLKLGLQEGQYGCENNPYILIPCYVEGPLSKISSLPAIIKLREQSEGHDFANETYGPNYQGVSIVDYGDVGTVYGVAWQGKHKKGYAAAFHKRYADFGPSGPDAIYQVDLENGVLGVIELDALTNTTNSTGSNAHDFSPHSDSTIYDLGLNDQSFDAVGKRSFGDIELSGDEKTLYAVNLWDRKIYAFDVSTGVLSNVTITNSWATPDPTNAGRHRPFGLGWHNEKLWLGTVDDNGSNAYVHSFSPTTGGFQLELTIPLTYSRQPYFGDADNSGTPSDWNEWRSSTNFNYLNEDSEIAYPQPILSDIEFTIDGSMILGFRDRFGDQAGSHKFFNPNSSARTWGIAQGDILKACYIGGTFILESGTSGSCPVSGGLAGSGPGGTEFYHWDIFQLENRIWNPNTNKGAFHWETTQGGLVQFKSSPYVITTALDPYRDFSGGILKLNNQTGTRHNTNATSSATTNLGGGYTIYEGGEYNNALPEGSIYAGKVNGLGDLEGACSMDISIGNYVWHDVDMDGVQDPSEPPLKNVLVSLYEDGNNIGSVNTDSLGMYFFGGTLDSNLNSGIRLSPATSYEIRINYSDARSNDNGVTNIGGLSITNASNLINSDAEHNGSYAQITMTTNDSFYVDYSYDFGFISCIEVTSENHYTGCQGDGYTSTVGTSTYSESITSGIDTLLTLAGCDSIVSTLLTFNPAYDIANDYTGCFGDGYSTIVNGNTYNETNPNGIDSLLSTHGCDSIITTTLIFSSPTSTTNSYTGCEGDGYSSTVGINTYDESNPNGIDTLQNVHGCDSVVTTGLTFHPLKTTTIDYFGLSGDGYMITVNGVIYDESNPSGTEVINDSNGCDSTVNISLTYTAPTVTCTELIFDDFESGAGNWLDGGSDALRFFNSFFASSGNFSFRLRDNTNTSVITTSSSYDLSDVDSVKVNFHAYPLSLENTEDLWFQVSDNNGASYTTVKAWANGAEFTNSSPQTIQFAIAGPFTSTTRFRFRLDASGNADYVLLDDIRIETCIAEPVLCPILALQDTLFCNGQIVQIDPAPIGGSGTYTNHQWKALESGSAVGYSLTDTNLQVLTVDLNTSSSGLIDLVYMVTDSTGCSISDTMQIVVSNLPICEIESDRDTICSGISTTLSMVTQYPVSPFEGIVVSASSGPGVTQDHTIYGVQDPINAKLVITLPTWDDHFDSTFLNGELLFPKILETNSYNAGGMNCLTPWIPNINGLPRSIIEIKSGSVRYFSSRTSTSTTMTEVFPSNWVTTARNLIEGDNLFRFGVQNTAGPVSGSWSVEVYGNEGYTYLWGNGATTDSITIAPNESTTYSVTTTSPNGCTSTCSYDIIVQNIEIETEDVLLCSGNQVDVISTINLAKNPISHIWGPVDTLLAGISLTGTNSDTLQILANNEASGMMSFYHHIQDNQGCEVTDTFLLTISSFIRDSIYVELCTGSQFQFGDSTITQSGFYEKTDDSQQGCDSVTIAEIFFTPVIMDTLIYSGCQGDGYSVTVNGNIYDESQPQGSETLTTVLGCDSIVSIDLNFADFIVTYINYTGCSDDGFATIVNGTFYNFNNPTGTEVTTASNGCDSTIYVNLVFELAAIVEAGMPSHTLCSNSDLVLSTLGASISGGINSGIWTTTGDGTFNNGGDFATSTMYTPGPNEIASGEIILNLTSDNPPGSCEPEVDAAMILINDISCSQFPWVGN